MVPIIVTEALQLGRSGSAQANERRVEHWDRDPRPHVAIALTPRVIGLGLSRRHRADHRWKADTMERVREIYERQRVD